MQVYRIVRLNFKTFDGVNVCTEGPRSDNTAEKATTALCGLAGIGTASRVVMVTSRV